MGSIGKRTKEGPPKAVEGQRPGLRTTRHSLGRRWPGQHAVRRLGGVNRALPKGLDIGRGLAIQRIVEAIPHLTSAELGGAADAMAKLAERRRAETAPALTVRPSTKRGRRGARA